MNCQCSKDELKKRLLDTLVNEMHMDPQQASDETYYDALCRVTQDFLGDKLRTFSAHYNARAQKKVYYMSMEFLMGRSLKNSLYNLCIPE